MSSQWEAFCRNLGEWRGSFTSLSSAGEEGESNPSLLSLSQGAEERLVHFKLLRFPADCPDGPPSREVSEDYRTLGKQVVFFENGSFCKGTLQVAPGSIFGGEFGFIHADRRHRLVELHSSAGMLDGFVLIREFRVGSEATERPRLSAEQLEGFWSGQAAMISADWPEPERQPCSVSIRATGEQRLELTSDLPNDPGAANFHAASHRLNWLADGGYSLAPVQVSHRQGFSVEAGWLSGSDRLERMIRCFDHTGAWTASWQLVLQRRR